MKKKPQLAIAYYADGQDGEIRNNAYVYVSLDRFSDKEFRKKHKLDFGYAPSDFDVYPVEDVNDVNGDEYIIKLERKGEL